MKILRAILFAAGALLLIDAAIIAFMINPTIGLLLQFVVSIGMILYAAFLKKIPKKLHIAMGALCLIPLIFMLSLGIYGNVSHTDHKEDAVIVLGAGVNGESVTRILAHRLNTAADYWSENPDAYIVVTGGLGNRATITEAEAMTRFLAGKGVSRDRILLEDQSTSTYENLVFAKAILDERFPDGFRAVLITNDFHIYRAVRTARQAGISAGHIGAYTDWYMWPVNYLREMLAVVNYWAFAKPG